MQRPNNLEEIKQMYPVGSRVKLLKMDEDIRASELIGTEGEVKSVDDMGTIHVLWDKGFKLGVLYGEDEIEVVEPVANNSLQM
ncbi:MAG: DUF4314 domain-containing protein [bacterium]